MKKSVFPVSMAILWGNVFTIALHSWTLGICIGLMMGIIFGVLDSDKEKDHERE